VVGAQLSVIQMNRAIEVLGDELGVDIKEFTVAAILEEDNYLHRWYLGTNSNQDIDEPEAAQRLDEIIKENNKNYKVARSKALKSVQVKIIPNKLFQLWAEETNQKGGQVKVPRVMNEEVFSEWERFVERKMK
jgi:hypothetical protein